MLTIKGSSLSGINTNSEQYKAAKKMLDAAKAQQTPLQREMDRLFQNKEPLYRNWMSSFDADGDMLNSNGIAGMDITNKSPSEWQQIIDISDESKQKIFDMVKKEFIAEKGVHNGDTTNRSEVFADFQRSIPKSDRLKGSWTLEQYERQYFDAMYSAVKASSPNWMQGDKFDANVLDHVTRESVDSRIIKSGSDSLTTNSIDYTI